MSERAWDGSSRPHRRDDVVAVDVAGELVIWDAVRERVHRLDPVATLIWPFLDGGTPVDLLADDVAAVWGTTSETTMEGLIALLTQLDDVGLLVDGPKVIAFRPSTEAGASAD